MTHTPTYDEILTQMKTVFEEESGVHADDASDIGIRLKLLAGQLYSLSQNISFVAKQLFVDSASGKYLDMHAGMRGLNRRAATSAHGTVTFYTDTEAKADIDIPGGTICATANALSQYETTGGAVLAKGSTEAKVPVAAVISGSKGNAAAQCITVLITPPQGIAGVVNEGAISGGSEQETDELLRRRITESYSAMSNGANIQYYKEIAMQNPKVLSANVISCARGAGTVDVIFDTALQDPQEITLLQEELTQAFAHARELGKDVLAVCCSYEMINARVFIRAGGNYAQEDVINECKEKIAQYFAGLRVGENMIAAKLGDIIFRVPGVVNYKLVTPFEDTSIAGSSKLKINSLTVENTI